MSLHFGADDADIVGGGVSGGRLLDTDAAPAVVADDPESPPADGGGGAAAAADDDDDDGAGLDICFATFFLVTTGTDLASGIFGGGNAAAGAFC